MYKWVPEACCVKFVERHTNLEQLCQWESEGADILWLLWAWAPATFIRNKWNIEPIQCLKNLEFQLVLGASSSHIVLAEGHLLLVLVNDFIRGWVVLTLIGQVSLKSYLSSKKIHLTRTYWLGLVLSPAIGICRSSFLRLLIVHVNVYIQQLEIWATALLEEISNIDKFFILLWMFFYSKLRDNHYYSGTSI